MWNSGHFLLFGEMKLDNLTNGLRQIFGPTRKARGPRLLSLTR